LGSHRELVGGKRVAGARPGRQLLFIALSLGIGLLVVEGMLRAYAVFGGTTGSRLAAFDPMAMLYEPLGEFGYRQKPNTIYTFGNGVQAISNGMSYRGPEVSIPKPEGTTRIVLLGGSTTHGYGVTNDETIDVYMREILAASYPRRRFEVVNLALGGYDSYQLFERMRSDGVRMQPDIVIINSGINDVRNAQYADLQIPGPDPRTLIWESHLSRAREEARRGGPSLWTLAKHHLYLMRMPGFVRERVREVQQVDANRTIRPMPDALDYFEANIERTASLAQALGAPIVYATPASRLSTYPPDATSTQGYWIVDAATTEDYRRQLARRLAALSRSQADAGMRVTYVDPSYPADHFLENDDCHLNAKGNQAAARVFVDAAEPFLD
jgi:lysophospholipase L1-like esterase